MSYCSYFLLTDPVPGLGPGEVCVEHLCHQSVLLLLPPPRTPPRHAGLTTARGGPNPSWYNHSNRNLDRLLICFLMKSAIE